MPTQVFAATMETAGGTGRIRMEQPIVIGSCEGNEERERLIHGVWSLMGVCSRNGNYRTVGEPRGRSSRIRSLPSGRWDASTAVSPAQSRRGQDGRTVVPQRTEGEHHVKLPLTVLFSPFREQTPSGPTTTR